MSFLNNIMNRHTILLIFERNMSFMLLKPHRLNPIDNIHSNNRSLHFVLYTMSYNDSAKNIYAEPVHSKTIKIFQISHYYASFHLIQPRKYARSSYSHLNYLILSFIPKERTYEPLIFKISIVFYDELASSAYLFLR